MKPAPGGTKTPSEARYRIGGVVRATGIGAETLRAWERRYGALHPARTPRGGRLYSDGDVARLKLLRKLTERGHAISQVAQLSEDELRGLLSRLEPGAAGAGDLVGLRRRLLQNTLDLAVGELQMTVSRTALLLDPPSFVLELAMPLLREVGDGWAEGSVRVACEHAVSSVLRSALGAMLAMQGSGADAGRVLLAATPVDEQHELGALGAAVLAAAAGWRAVYLGPNLPAREIAAAVERTRARAVALSVVNPPTPSARRDVARLPSLLPASVTVVAGGAHAADVPELVRRARVFPDLQALDAWLRNPPPVDPS